MNSNRAKFMLGVRAEEPTAAPACAVIPLCPHGKFGRECLPCLQEMLESTEEREWEWQNKVVPLTKTIARRERKYKQEKKALERQALAAEAKLAAVEKERDDAGTCFVHERAEHSRTADQLRLATERVRALEEALVKAKEYIGNGTVEIYTARKLWSKINQLLSTATATGKEEK